MFSEGGAGSGAACRWLLVGSPPQDPPAGSGRGCTAPQPRPGGVVNMECGLAGPAPPSWGVTCLPLPHKSLLLQQQMHQGSTWEDNGQGTTAEKVKPRCEAMLSTDIKDG